MGKTKTVEERLDLIEQKVDRILKYISFQSLGAPEDEIYNEVVEWIKGKKFTTYNQVQRNFNIGYARTARLLDLLERDGFISAQKGRELKRKVLVPTI